MILLQMIKMDIDYARRYDKAAKTLNKKKK